MKLGKFSLGVFIATVLLLLGLGGIILVNVIRAAQEQTSPVVAKGTHQPKKGVALAYPNCEDLGTLDAEWYINFQTIPSDGCPSTDQRFVPMVYGVNSASGVALTTVISNAKASGWLLGFGEPNLPWNGNTTPQEGARAWRAIEQAAIPAGIKLVAPGVSQHEPGFFDPLGHTWIWKMVAEYEKLYGKKPHFDAMGWNIYERDPKATIDFLNARREEAVERGYTVPFWVLEYAGRCWDTGKYPTGNEDIMTEVTPWFKSKLWITRYAWFANRITGTETWGQNHQSCSLIDPGTDMLTSLGRIYAKY